MVECKSRGAYLMGLTTYGHYNIEDTADFTVYIPKTDPHFATSLAVIPLQLLGYYVRVAKGLDVAFFSKPQNLMKIDLILNNRRMFRFQCSGFPVKFKSFFVHSGFVQTYT